MKNRPRAEYRSLLRRKQLSEPKLKGRVLKLTVALILGASLAGDVGYAAPPGPNVRGVLMNFFQAYLGRNLTAAEATSATQEFVAKFGADDCESNCAFMLKSLVSDTRLFLRKRNTPRALDRMHLYTSAGYFQNSPHVETLKRLLLEPDPPALVVPEAFRIMTERDLIAVAALATTVRTGDLAELPALTTGQRTAQLARLREVKKWFGGLPLGVTFAAEFYAGIRCYGKNLSAEERRQVARFATGKEVKPISASLIDRVLHVGKARAEWLHGMAQFELDRMLY